MSWLLAPFAVCLGVVLTSQIATNAQLGKALGNPYIPATVNMVFGLIVTFGGIGVIVNIIIVYILVQVRGERRDQQGSHGQARLLGGGSGGRAGGAGVREIRHGRGLYAAPRSGANAFWRPHHASFA